jgi:ABC-2 type transport system ATP-binding protein
MSTAALRITQLAKRYGGVAVLDGVDLTLNAGECLALTGLNGAGKTTLLHCLLDFIPADAGSIEINGLAHRNPRARRGVAYLPERFLPPPYLSGREFLHYAARLHGMHWDGSSELNPAILDSKASAWSKGMGQQLGLAACLLVRPALLVLDEPFSGLDPQATFGMRDTLNAARDAGIAILYTTHDLRDIEVLSDRIALLQSGQLRTIEREQIADESLFVHHASQ